MFNKKIFSEKETATLKQSIKEIDDSIDESLYDIKKQNMILKGRIEQSINLKKVNTRKEKKSNDSANEMPHAFSYNSLMIKKDHDSEIDKTNKRNSKTRLKNIIFKFLSINEIIFLTKRVAFVVLIFSLGLVTPHFMNFNIFSENNQKIDSNNVYRSENGSSKKITTIHIHTVSPEIERQNYSLIALNAGLEVQFLTLDEKKALKIFNINSTNDNQLKLKSRIGLSPTVYGDVVLIFQK